MTKKEPIAVYTVSNSIGILIYEAESDYILAGVGEEEPEYYEVEYLELEEGEELEACFKIGEMRIPLSQCMRIKF